ncbi:MAG TPA: polyprenyl synthetase family protein [Candidatus Saccharimonadales bacterium]|nr:polyprenyl synthetase family protein [Candidatus Saccharimonadales bacterium]
MKPLTKYGPRLRAELDSFLAAQQAAASGAWSRDFLRRLRRFAGDGKLLRGSLVCFSYQAWSGRRPGKAVMRTALAVELAHSGLLIHDDIMDGDQLRRGRPSMHHQYELLAKRRRLANPAGFGTAMALSGGDIALFLAFELLNAAGSTSARRIFSEQLLQTCGGQMQDIYLGAMTGEADKPAIYAVMEQKTARYSLAMPLSLGAALAAQPPSVLQKMQAIGRLAGIIFQIRDDELGVLGSQRLTGKPVGADIRENKKTLLRYYLMQHATAAEQQRLRAVFGNPAAAKTDIRYVQSLLRHYQIPALVAEEIAALQQEASEHVARLPLSPAARQAFQDVVDFCAQRQF